MCMKYESYQCSGYFKPQPKPHPYFQENRNLKYVEVERMAKNLHESYPEYRRKKFKTFKSQVETAFRICCDEMASRRKEKKKKSVLIPSHNSGASVSKSSDSASSVEEIR